MIALEKALSAWRDVIGSEYVISDEKTLAQAQTATFLTRQRIPAILQPANRQEIQECVRIANSYQIPLYPISRGKNWGYGSQVPVRDGCVVLSLQRLNRIVEYNERLAYMTVEPGVTIEQARTFLLEHKAHLMVCPTGGPEDGSLIGNVLERGIGIGRYADRFGHVCGFEIILPTGECLHTGFERFPSAQTGPISRWSVGPYLDGLFTQSNLGIVTQMTIWLMPMPKYSQLCYFTLDQEEHFEDLIDTLYQLKFEGGYTDHVRIYNDYRSLSQLLHYPEAAYLTPDTMKSIRSVFNLGVWNGVLPLHSASEHLGAAMRELIQNMLVHKVDSLYFSGGKQSVQNGTSPGKFHIPRESAELLERHHLRAAYWKKQISPSSQPDLDRDRCGVIWCAPLIPFTGNHARAAKEIVEQVCLAHRREPHITLTCLTERTIVLTALLLYDREIAGEDERAMDCHNDLLRELITAGYYPYRLGIQSMDSLPTPTDDYNVLLQRLKTALDPNGILAPGRYDFK